MNRTLKIQIIFLKKLKEIGSLPKNTILCTIDVVGLYPNIPHEEGLASIRKHLDNRESKEVTTNTLVELADIVLKNNYFQFLDKTFKKKKKKKKKKKMGHANSN